MHPLVGNGNGRKSILCAKSHLKVFRRKFAILELFPKFLDHHIQFPQISVEQIGNALAVQLTKLLLGIFPGILMGNIQGLLHAYLLKTTQIPDVPGSIFQHRMDIGTEFRRVHRGFLPLLSPKAITKEVGQPAFGLPVYLGSGHIQGLSVKLFQVLALHLSQRIITATAGGQEAFLSIQLGSGFGRIPTGKPGSGFPFVRQGKVHGQIRLFFAAGQAGKSAEHKRRLYIAAVDPDALRSTAEYAINLCKFCLNTFHGAAGKRHTHGSQGHTLLVGKHTGRTGVAGQIALPGAQHQKMFLLMAAHSTHRTHLHRIQNRRNGSNSVLAQQQPQQPAEMFRLPLGLTKHIIQLFQSGNQDLPKLIEDLSVAVVPLGIQIPGHRQKSVFQAHIFQEGIQSQHLILELSCLQETAAELIQRFHRLLHSLIQLLHLVSGIVRPISSQTIRVLVPGFGPLTAPNTPDDSIVFHLITLIRGQGRQTGA